MCSFHNVYTYSGRGYKDLHAPWYDKKVLRYTTIHIYIYTTLRPLGIPMEYVLGSSWHDKHVYIYIRNHTPEEPPSELVGPHWHPKAGCSAARRPGQQATRARSRSLARLQAVIACSQHRQRGSCCVAR